MPAACAGLVVPEDQTQQILERLRRPARAAEQVDFSGKLPRQPVWQQRKEWLVEHPGCKAAVRALRDRADFDLMHRRRLTNAGPSGNSHSSREDRSCQPCGGVAALVASPPSSSSAEVVIANPIAATLLHYFVCIGLRIVLARRMRAATVWPRTHPLRLT